MKHLQQRFRVSERRACRVVGQPRSSQRHVSEKVTKDAALSERIVSISRENPRYGYRRVWALLRREGWEVNKKRVQRLWREADLKVPAKQHKRRRRSEGSSHNGCTKRRAEYPGHVWSYDFAMDSTEDASHWLRIFGAESGGGTISSVQRYEVFFSAIKDAPISERSGESSSTEARRPSGTSGRTG